ncbi:F-box/kelch-repeat protein At3g06240-like [Papaver somniferum]|uniref:F-box/kelch-repeat protein At3g06240-like n=1 Tax=Papaver somniferum TaxID=3469 RepID=UPI000E703FE0|nr:F-box/kelch-repeat protein At3g06240-like [Papaver somniferum]
MVAFGYDCKCNDYKLFAAGSTSSRKMLFDMYSVALNSWKSIEEVPYGFPEGFKSGVLVNGNFHWLADRPEDCSGFLVSLDISNEIFKEMELPIENLEDDLYFYEVGVLEGCLGLLEDLYDDHVRLWVMQNYGVGDSWTVRYTFKDHRILNRDVRLTWSFKSGEILLGGVGTYGLLVCDPKYGRNREPNVSRSRLYQQELYFESLVSLKSSTYVDGKEEIEEPNKKKTRN